jgi:hypothetical protein
LESEARKKTLSYLFFLCSIIGIDQTDSRFAPSPGTASDDAASPFELQPGAAPDRLAFEPVPLRHRRDGLTAEKQREYVEALADTGVVREAAARIGISEQAISRVRRRADARDFDRACEAAHMFGARRLLSTAWERAIEGTLKGHYYHGELVSQERVYDNRLLIYLLGKTGHLLEPAAEARAVCDNWEAHMDALEQGLPPPALDRSHPGEEEDEEKYEPGEDPRASCDEDGIWWTYFPPPEGFDGKEEGELGDPFYKRTMTAEEEAAALALEAEQDSAEIARWCAMRDRYFGLPPRGCNQTFFLQESRNNETSEPSEEAEDWSEGPIEYKSLVPPCRHPGESRDLGATRRDFPARGPGVRRDDGSGASSPPYRHRRFRSIPKAAGLWGKNG